MPVSRTLTDAESAAPVFEPPQSSWGLTGERSLPGGSAGSQSFAMKIWSSGWMSSARTTPPTSADLSVLSPASLTFESGQSGLFPFVCGLPVGVRRST